MRTPTEEDVARHKEWVDDGGKESLVTFDFLTRDSLVWEIGGWHGEWAATIAKKYDPWITVFEPVWDWFVDMKEMFSSSSKINVINYGLGDADGIKAIGVSEDSSGPFCDGKEQLIQIRSVADVVEEPIDLVQCNCEGGEYEIFPQLIKNGLVQKFGFIIIQFHNCHESHPKARKEIQDGLRQTHRQVACWDWKFEYWERI